MLVVLGCNFAAVAVDPVVLAVLGRCFVADLGALAVLGYNLAAAPDPVVLVALVLVLVLARCFAAQGPVVLAVLALAVVLGYCFVADLGVLAVLGHNSAAALALVVLVVLA